ncbi:uncharacterized protein [Argopecten irradians]|uniref:uncharacterized protein n=1 Tax=Argopecten irradians TaxID=31199 RepID=UPI00371CCFE6
MLTKFFCVLCVIVTVSAFPMDMFGGQNNVAPVTDFFSKFIPKGIMANMTSNPALRWIPDFISQTINAVRERKTMNRMKQPMVADVDMGGLGGILVQSPGGSTGLSLSSRRRGQGLAMAADYPMADYLPGGYGGMARIADRLN